MNLKHFDLIKVRKTSEFVYWNLFTTETALNTILSFIKVHKIFLSNYTDTVYLDSLLDCLFLYLHWLKELPYCLYTHAGPKLLDKKLCYLKTVIVTANV